MLLKARIEFYNTQHSNDTQVNAYVIRVNNVRNSSVAKTTLTDDF
jgi:hypothetical protein